MRRPSFQFYPADWLGNANLKRCTPAEKGMWIDIMCLMHGADEYGILRWPLKEIASAIGVRVQDVQGLVRKGVLKGADGRCSAFIYTPRSGRKEGPPVTIIEDQDGPVWFSSRMVTDEYVRTARGEASKPAPKPPFGDNKGEAESLHPSCAGPSSSSSSSSTSLAKPTGLVAVGNAVLEAMGTDPAKFVGHFGGLAEQMRQGATGDELIRVAERLAARPGWTPKRDPIAFLLKALSDQLPVVREEMSRPPPMSPAEEWRALWSQRVAGYARRGLWLPSWGPSPAEEGCEAPTDILAEARADETRKDAA